MSLAKLYNLLTHLYAEFQLYFSTMSNLPQGQHL